MTSTNLSTNIIAFDDVCVFTGDYFIEKGFVIVEKGQIIQVGHGQCPDIPSATKVSKPGHTLLPGLIDSHVHGLFGNEHCIEESLRFGATTVCDLHNEPKHIAHLQNLASSEKSRYSDFKCCGVGATIEGGWPAPVVLSHGATPEAKATVDSWPKLKEPADTELFVQQQIDNCGASYIKIMHELGDSLGLPVQMPRPPVELWKAVVQAAHARGLIVVGHAYSSKGSVDLLNAGVDGLTHIFLDKPESDEYVKLFLQTGAHCNPTLTGAASQAGQVGELQKRFTADPLAQQMLFNKIPRGPLGLAAKGTQIEQIYENTRALYRAGVPIMVGSDASGQPRGQAYGLTVHMEMWQMVHRIHMTVVDVLKGATSLVADRFGFSDRGRIRSGLKADLVLVEGDIRDVMADINTSCLPLRGVWREGILAEAYKNYLR